MLYNNNSCYKKSSLDVAATNQAILADGLISFDMVNVNTGASVKLTTGKVITLANPGLYHVDVQATVEPAAAGLVTMNLLKGRQIVPGKTPAATATAAGDAVSLTTAADILVPCCAAPATISAQVDVAGTVVSATMVVTKMA